MKFAGLQQMCLSLGVASRYDQYLSFTNVELPYGAYVSLICYMPPNYGGALRGVAAYQ